MVTQYLTNDFNFFLPDDFKMLNGTGESEKLRDIFIGGIGRETGDFNRVSIARIHGLFSLKHRYIQRGKSIIKKRW